MPLLRRMGASDLPWWLGGVRKDWA
jgi:hypothetical protein